MFICMQKINFIPSFLKYCKKYLELAILSTLDIPGYDQQKQY